MLPMGAKEAITDSLSLDTKEMVREVERTTREVRDKLKAEYVIIESIIPISIWSLRRTSKEEILILCHILVWIL